MMKEELDDKMALHEQSWMQGNNGNSGWYWVCFSNPETHDYTVCLLWIGFFIFILLSRENDRGAIHTTNPHSLRTCLCFLVFRLSFVSDFFNLLLVRFHQAGLAIVEHLIQDRYNVAWVGVEPSTCSHSHCKNDASNHYAVDCVRSKLL